MDSKVLIRLFVPELEENYEVYIPINLKVGMIVYQLSKVVNDLANVYPLKDEICLCNRRNGKVYENERTIKDTDIRNGSELILL